MAMTCPKTPVSGQKMHEQKCYVTRQIYTITISRWGGGRAITKNDFPRMKPRKRKRGTLQYQILQYRKKNWEIPKYQDANQRNPDTALRSLSLVTLTKVACMHHMSLYFGYFVSSTLTFDKCKTVMDHFESIMY